MHKPFVMITATGKDKPGLITEITESVAKVNGNIIDIEAFSMRGLFAIFTIVDTRKISVPLESLKTQLMNIGKQIMEGMMWHYHTPKEQLLERTAQALWQTFHAFFLKTTQTLNEYA